MGFRFSAAERVVISAVVLDIAIGVPLVALGLMSGAASATSEAIRVVLLVAIDIFSVAILLAVNRHRFNQFEFGIEKVQILVQIVIAFGMCISVVFIGHKIYEAVTVPSHLPNYLFCVLFALLSYVNTMVNVFSLRRMLAQERAAPSIILRGQIRNRIIMLTSGVVATISAAAVIIPDPKLFALIDALGALLVLCVLCYTTVRMLAGGVLALLDAPIDETDKLRIYREIVERFDEWRSIAFVRTRQLGHNSYVEIGLCFDDGLSLPDAMAVCRRVQQGIEARLPQAFVWVHPAEDPAMPEQAPPAALAAPVRTGG